MLAVARARCLRRGGEQGVDCHDLAIEPVRPGRWIDVGRVGGTADSAQSHGLRDHLRIEKRTVGGQANDNVRSARSGGARTAIEHVVL